MAEPHCDEDHQRAHQRIAFLEQANLRYISLLEMLGSTSHFQAELNRDRTCQGVFNATFQQVQRLLPQLDGMAFYLNDDDNSFELSACSPGTSSAQIEVLVEEKIDDGSFAWALNQNRSVLSPVESLDKTLLLHVLATQSRIRGMFIILLPSHNRQIDAPSLNALSNVLLTTAYALESTTLYNMLKQQNRTLEIKVEERTRELRHSQQQAEAASRAKSAFLATMSHELRTPLNAVIGFSSVLKQQDVGALNEEQQEYIDYVLQSSRHLLSLINDILDLSKIEADKMELYLNAVNLKELVDNALVMIKHKAQQNNIHLQIDVSPATPDIWQADERKLKQILYNLLSNAVKFSPPDGEIRIALQPTENRRLYLTISDTGIGIPQEDLARIFEPFEQVDDSTTREFEGTGLGLSLTKRLVELHGGTIWATSAGQAQGSTFHVQLPERPGPESAETP